MSETTGARTGARRADDLGHETGPRAGAASVQAWPRPREVGEAFHAAYETPGVMKPYAYKLVTPEEEALILYLHDGPKTAADVAARFGMTAGEAEALLAFAYRRANAHKSRDAEGAYTAATLYDRLGVFTQYEQASWREIPRQDREAIDEWYVGAFTDRMRAQMEREGDAFHRDSVLPIEQALAEIERIWQEKGVDYFLVPCNCRTTSNNCHHSLNTCLANYYGPNGAWDRGYGKKLTIEEVREVMRAADREGLMHTVSPSGHICNCETCCCYEFRAAERLQSKGRYPRVGHVAVFDEALCVGCGACEKRCRFGAFRVGEGAGGGGAGGGRKASFDPELCWGCGVCAVACPKQAITVAAREPASAPACALGAAAARMPEAAARREAGAAPGAASSR
jgi:NAD-dependent dihydropyrimidine dehydrogenase PreA subunit